ncbi:HNH endonuclease [Mesorhizobium sp. CO1-1-11]|uniref:HNH endonuclease n=1 Tax=Mesorhizobium sp. CO1-1-11 TaxID=2876636 RepID=UPI001CC96765|nr:HNH endonuclease [Mesorhizobium sp. CO1-1-11]MBZ9726361.1 HNH endonuclease [Mesorhizobium sp. CO1-1-11]
MAERQRARKHDEFRHGITGAPVAAATLNRSILLDRVIHASGGGRRTHKRPSCLSGSLELIGLKGIFDTKANSGYDDEITRRYHFPPQYRAIAQRLVGEWIVYREPQRNRGRRAYIAVARVLRIDPDPGRPGYSYALVEDYLPFDRPVPFSGAFYAEAALREIGNPSRVGAYLQGKSIRTISEADFAAIARAGFDETLAPENAVRLELDYRHVDPETLDLLRAPPEDQARRIEQILVNRKVRDANFRRQICEAYDNRCAVTGLRMVNGGGKAEVQAAHIWPVASGGPDVVQNGLALSGTVHWLFDRHLISLTDDYRLLVSHNKVPDELRSLFAHQLDRIHLPQDPKLWPHPGYVAKHREAFSGG